ncbi:MAG: DEAD/DEAH box helicase family protein [Alphaproteobacteria bacterium]|nr:DEAD/DEAH box helicase family protein [Alphaproteobacteria bacterium]
MKADAHKQVQYLRHGMEQFLADEDKHIANGAPRLRGEQYFALGALTKLSDTQIAASYYKLPTGFGKTVMFSYMAQAYLPQARANGDTKKLVILVPRLNLINQTSDKLDSFAGFSASEFSGRTKDTDADIIISTYRSLDKLVETIGIENIGLIFADEAHHVTGDKISQTMTDLIKSVPTIGFTATPSYDANKSVSNVLSTEIFAMTIADCVHSGMLSPIKNTLYCSSIVYDLENAPATSNGEYDYNSITGQIDTDTLTSEIADIYINGVDEDTGRRFIDCKAMINCPNIEMAKRQADAINQRAGRIIARAFSSDMKDFEIEKAKFIAGKYQVACQVNTMTEGFDDPTVSLCINYPTRSAVRAEQAAGRAIRLNESDPHKIAFVIDTIFRKHDNETSDTALQTARHAKQVLFKDIAGGMVLFPENFKDGITHGKHRPHTRGNHETVKPYEIITSTETLLDLNRVDTERAKEEEIPEKTDEWLNVQELTQYFPYRYNLISEKLVALAGDATWQKEMPGKIEKRRSGYNNPLCLHISALDEFARRSELEKRVPKKTSEWLSAKELTQYFPYAAETISKKLDDLAGDATWQKEMPGKIEKRQSGSRIPLCLHIDALDEFARRSEFVPKKTSEWLTAKELRQYFPYAPEKISDKLVALAGDATWQKEMPGKIEKRRSGPNNPLCLHISALDEFARQSELEKRVPQKTSEWLTAEELTQYFPYARDTISKKLDDLAGDATWQKEMPGKIEKRQSGPRTPLCLHISALDEFARRSEFVPKKTNEWLTATELTQYFPYARDTISEKLDDLAGDATWQKEMPGKIEKRRSGSNNPLCLHISALDEFARRSELAPKKTSEWLTAKELTQYFPHTAETISKKLVDLAGDATWQKKMPGKIEKRQSGVHTVPCLHIDALGEFARSSGFKRRGEVTPEKFHAGNKVVKAMNQMAESKEQTKDTITPDNQYE